MVIKKTTIAFFNVMRYSFLLIFFQFLLVTVAFSNTINVTDENNLLNNIISEKDYELKAINYLRLIKFYQKINFDKSIKYSDEAIEFCSEHKLTELEIEVKIEKARSYFYFGHYDGGSDIIFKIEKDIVDVKNDRLLGEFYMLKNLAFIISGEYTKAMDNALTSIIYFKKSNDTLGLAKAYNNIGAIYDYTNNNQKALDNYIKSRKYAFEQNDYELVADLDNNIGIVYDNLKDYDKALIYYYKSLEYSNSIGDLKSSSSAFNNIASSLSHVKRYDEALIYYKKGLKISIEIKDLSIEALLNYNIGDLFVEINMLDSAEFFLNKSLQLYNEINDPSSLSENYFSLAKLFVKQKKDNKAIEALNKSIELSEQLGDLLLKEKCLKMLSGIYENRGDYKTAYKHQHIAFEIADSLRANIRVEELKYSDFQIEFQNQSELFNKDLERHEISYKLELERQKYEKYTYALLLILIIIVSVVLYKNFKKSRIVNKQLVLKNREVEDQKELVEISNVELREQYAFTETLLNTIPNPVFYTDKNGFILGSNKAFEDVIGKSVDSFMGIKLNKINSTIDNFCDTSHKFVSANKELIIKEGVFTYGDGTDHDVICYRNGIINPNKKLMGVLGIIIDITHIKDAEKKLLFSQTRLKEVINAKDKFFNIMAHDLKNPFNAVLGLTSLIKDDYESHSKTELKEIVSLINQSAHQIYNLLENLLEWARAQSGSIEKRPSKFIVNQIIQESVNLFSSSIDQKNIKLIISLKKEIEVFADKNMVMTVLRNLLSNAIKYTNENGEIKILVEEFQKHIQVSVNDNGVGIEPNNLKRLFKIDQPVSTPGIKNEKGTGLGLIICKEFVKQNGGILSVESELHKGSTFSFSIPTE